MKHKTVRSLLLCAKRLLVKKGWCQGQYAKYANGNSCEIDDPKAARFCMIGAIERCAGRARTVRFKAEATICRIIGDFGIAGFNDQPGRKKSEVLAVFDTAIKDTRKT